MKSKFLVSTMVLLVALLPHYECRAVEIRQADPQQPSPSHPFLLRLGEEYFIRLGNQQQQPELSPNALPDESSGALRRALYTQIARQRLLQGRVSDLGHVLGNYGQLDQEDSAERGKRSDEPPISLDLTFHLLREVLEMARAEQLAQQAHNNRKIMEIIGK